MPNNWNETPTQGINRERVVPALRAAWEKIWDEVINNTKVQVDQNLWTSLWHFKSGKYYKTSEEWKYLVRMDTSEIIEVRAPDWFKGSVPTIIEWDKKIYAFFVNSIMTDCNEPIEDERCMFDIRNPDEVTHIQWYEIINWNKIRYKDSEIGNNSGNALEAIWKDVRWAMRSLEFLWMRPFLKTIRF